MLVEVKVPILAESIAEATLAAWNKKAGDYVRQDENLVDLETDKVMLEIVAPKDGVIKEIRKNDGTNVKSDEVIAVIDTDANNTQVAAAAKPHIEDVKEDKIKVDKIEKASREVIQHHAELSPAVRKLVAENHLDINKIKGTGRHGRITKDDVLNYLTVVKTKPEEKRRSEPAPVVKPLANTQLPQAALSTDLDVREERRVPMSRLRARIAERLKEAQNTAAILTTFNEVNMQQVMDLRNKYKDRFAQRYEIKLGFMSFFTKAVVEALKQFPIINSSVDGTDIIYHNYYDVGIAVGSPRGLVVPILRNVDVMSFADIELAIQTYSRKAKDGKLSIEDLTGGTFSISNGGVYGSMMSTPILNPPQSAILGMHNIVDRPVVENGEIVIRPMMYLALSYDHRIVDGQDAVMFLIAVKQAIEDPTRMLLEL